MLPPSLHITHTKHTHTHTYSISISIKLNGKQWHEQCPSLQKSQGCWAVLWRHKPDNSDVYSSCPHLPCLACNGLLDRWRQLSCHQIISMLHLKCHACISQPFFSISKTFSSPPLFIFPIRFALLLTVWEHALSCKSAFCCVHIRCMLLVQSAIMFEISICHAFVYWFHFLFHWLTHNFFECTCRSSGIQTDAEWQHLKWAGDLGQWATCISCIHLCWVSLSHSFCLLFPPILSITNCKLL